MIITNHPRYISVTLYRQVGHWHVPYVVSYAERILLGEKDVEHTV